MREARALGLQVIDRCNLTVLLEPGQGDLVDFLAAHQVRFDRTWSLCVFLARCEHLVSYTSRRREQMIRCKLT